MKNFIKIILFLIIFNLFIINDSFAFWMWTPETNKWINPKYSVKDTPKEQLEYADGFFYSKEYKEAAKEYRKLISHYPKARQAPQAQFNLGKCYEELGAVFNAYKEYQMVIDKYPFSNLSSEVVDRQYKIGVDLMEGRGDRNKIINAIAGDKYDVIEIFRSVIKNAPYGKYAAPAQYKIGLYLLEKQLYQEARDEFEKTINDYPDTEWAHAARYQIALSDSKRSTDAQYDQKVTQAAIKEFKDIVKNNPDVELSDKAKKQISKLRDKEAENAYLIARFYEKQKNYSSAKMYYQAVVNEYKDSKWASAALKKILELSRKIK